MSNFRFNNKSRLIARRMRALYNKMNRELTSSDKSDVGYNTQSILGSFRDLYLNMGKPHLELKPFESKQVPRSAQINKTMAEIEEDLSIAYDEVETLKTSMVESFNYAQSLSKDLENASEIVGSKIIDLRLLDGQLDQEVLVAGDDFRTMEKIDLQSGLQNESADVLLDQGVVTLKRLSSKNIVNSQTTIDVTPVGPSTIKKNPTVNNVNRFYEGNFYNFAGSARPEGGRYHLEQTMSVNVEPTGLSVSYVTVDGTSTPSNFVTNVQNTLSETEEGGGGLKLRPEDVIIYDRGADEEEKNTIRSYMIDDNPATFWECEYVKTDAETQSLVEESKILGLDQESTIVDENGNIEEGIVSTVTIDDIRNEARASSATTEDDFIVDVTVRLDKPQMINWISLTPNNFEESAWIDIVDISYSNAQSSYQTIPGFFDAIQDNTLTEEANAELDEDEAGILLAPSRYAYKGIGVWSFQPVEATNIRIRIRQKTAVPSPYQRMAIRLHRVFTQVYTESQANTPGI
jgi:hypothetical protein